MAGQEKNILLALLRTQEELRILQQEDFDLDLDEHDGSGSHFRQRKRGSDSETSRYVSASNASIPSGASLSMSPSDRAQDVAWADHARTSTQVEFSNEDCPNGTNCLDDNFCFSWYDCDPCQWCENNQCVERNPDRECAADWECPCPPSEDQWYMCIDDRCALKCVSNDDCPFGEVCDPRDFFCKPGCENDRQCNPRSSSAAPDAKPDSYCVEAECVTPCNPPELCGGLDDRETCEEGQVCVDKKYRAPGDPKGALFECAPGCFENDDCERCFIDEDGEDVCFESVCIENTCVAVCQRDRDCATSYGEVCVSGECKVIGDICLNDSDCTGDGDLICTTDGRCTTGCRTASDCTTPCEPDADCVARCGPDPSCTCTDVYSGAICGTSQAEDWRQYCPRSHSCVSSCPEDKSCKYDNDRNWQCNEQTNQCFVECSSSGQCEQGYSCVTNETTGFRSCQWVKPNESEKVCEITEVCDEDADGNVHCVQTEECLFVSPVVDEDFYGCDCSETCTQKGQCAPAICKNDDECEDCSYCMDGACVPGCDDENPCPSKQCCGNDGRCHRRCSTDSVCPGAEMCLQGGCCGIACDPVTPCVNAKDCEEGERCNGDKICESGCDVDSDCGEGELCYQQQCQAACRFNSCSDELDCPRSDQSCASSGFCELDCGERQACGGEGFCIPQKDPCNNDSNCPDDITENCDADGNCTEEKTSRICFRGYCENGCRSDNDCGRSSNCFDGKCEFVCHSDLDCKVAGRGDKCKPNDDAYRHASIVARNLARTGADENLVKAWQFKAAKGRAGFCNSTGSSAEDPEEGRTGCYCFELCDETGRCERAPCETQNDCECASCLTDKKCGYCEQNADCPGVQVCDYEEECDKNGNNCVEKDYGICNYTCMPDEGCDSNDDCPVNSFCYDDPTRADKRVCAPGCRGDWDCLPGEGCNTPNGKCFPACEGVEDCNQENESCRDGLCVYTGYRCQRDYQCPAHLGMCSAGRCQEDTRCERDGDCPLSDVCTNGRCTKGERCDDSRDCQNTCDNPDDCKRRPGSGEDCNSSGDCTSGQSCYSFQYEVDCNENGENCSYETRNQCAFAPPVCSDGFCFGEDPDESRFCGPKGLCQQGQACRGDNDCNFPDICHLNTCQFVQRCNSSGQCPSDQYCKQGACELDNRCSSNGQCINRFGPGHFCNASRECQEEEKAESLEISNGCPDDCSFTCTNSFRCKKLKCATHDECPCGVCNMVERECTNECLTDAECGPGCKCDSESKSCNCHELACLTDSDCDRGVCFEGECVECLRDRDCEDLYPLLEGTGVICSERKCETPCYTAISDGDCFEGLLYGDLCASCRSSCPGGPAQCQLDGRVCGEYQELDLTTGEPILVPIECESCQKSCESDMDCRHTCIGVSDCEEYQLDASGDQCGPGLDCPQGEICAIQAGDEIGTCENTPVGCSVEECDEDGDNCVAGGFCFGSNLSQIYLCEADPLREYQTFCEHNNGSCSHDAHCQRWTHLDGLPRFCLESQCRISSACVGDSDCKPTELCINGVCHFGPDGPVDCKTSSDCGEGYGCNEDYVCDYICGDDAQAYPCRNPQSPADPGVECPEGYTCNSNTNLCNRKGYDGISQFMPNCEQGSTCHQGVCHQISKGDKYNCRSDADCNETMGGLCNSSGDTKWFCPPRTGYWPGQGGVKPLMARKCAEVFENGGFRGPQFPICGGGGGGGGGGNGSGSEPEKETICEKQGKCCGPDGFCQPCGCDDENPCEEGCCDRETGICMALELHPNTAYGAPAQCTFDEVFCEVLGPEGDGGERSLVSPLDFEGKLYPGCELVENPFGETVERCWEQGPLSQSQINTLMLQACDPYEEKTECDCDDIPTSDECYQDLDCGPRGECKAKTYHGDACCPLADELGNDYQVWNVCHRKGGQEGNADCLRDSDCTECEYCKDAQLCREGDRDCNPKVGTCTTDCLALCPCGGSASTGEDCPTCEKRYGKHCVESYTTEIGEESYDPETGEVIPAVDVCNCRILTELNCCEGFQDLEQVLQQRDGCLNKEFRLSDGTWGIAQVNYCANFEDDFCAECTEDAHCMGTQKCKGYMCTKECGGEDAEYFVGDCSCCTSDFECKEIFESWSEVRSVEGGQEQTRVCACTTSGIDCMTWQESESCYEWYLISEGSGERGKAERARMEDDLYDSETLQLQLETTLDEKIIIASDNLIRANGAFEDRQEACQIEGACQDSLTAWRSACADNNTATNSLQTARNDMSDITDAYEEVQDLRDLFTIYVEQACPDGTVTIEDEEVTCEEVTAGLADANDAIVVLETDTIPAQQSLINELELLFEAADTELDYWSEHLREFCEIETIRLDSCIGFDPEAERPECTAAALAHFEAETEYQAAEQDQTWAEIDVNDNLYKVVELRRQLNESPFLPPEWGQRRTCPCCVDGQCRDEDECLYGTCYLCTAPPEDLGSKDKYRAALWGKPHPEVEICVGCTDEQGKSLDGHKDCPDDAGGPSAVYFTEDGYSECVKYKCADGINIHQEPCYGWQSTWYDYCVGGLLGCLFSQDYSNVNINYWNGWDYTIACPLAGVWAYNSTSDDIFNQPEYDGWVPVGGGNWVQLSGPKEINGQYPLINRSRCAYPNPLGSVQGNWLPAFPDLVALHPCCMKSQIFHECDPEHPNCNTPLELLFEAGDPTTLIERLKFQVRAIENFLEQMRGLEGPLNRLEAARKRDLDDLKESKGDFESDVTRLENSIGQLEVDIALKESEIEFIETDLEHKSTDSEDAKTRLDDITDSRNDDIEERDTEEEAKAELDRYIAIERQNSLNAQQSIDVSNREANVLNMNIGVSQDQMINDQCVGGWGESEDAGVQELVPLPCEDCACDEETDECECQDVTCLGEDSIVCFEHTQLLESLIEEKQDLFASIDDLVQAASDHTAEADSAQLEADGHQGKIDSLQTSIDDAYDPWYAQTIVVGVLRLEIDDIIGRLNTARNFLVYMNEDLATLQRRLTNIEKDAGAIDQIDRAIEEIEEILANIENTREEIVNDVDSAKEAQTEKEAEIERLVEEYEIPEIPIGSAKPEPSTVKTEEQLIDGYEAMVEEHNEKVQDRWYPET